MTAIAGALILPHVISWKGWGLAVMLLTILWLFIVVGAFVVIGSVYPDSFYTPDKAEADAMAWRMIATCFALSAASVLLVSRHRNLLRQKAPDAVPPDEFMHLPLRFWPYILAVVALGMLVRSFFPQD